MAVVFLSVFGSFALLMYLSITTFSTSKGQAPSPYFRFQQSPVEKPGPQGIAKATTESAHTIAGRHRIILFRDKEIRVGRVMLTYRGLEERSAIRIDAVIPDLDSQYAYRQQFDMDKARKGFKVGGERLILISAGRYRLRLEHLASGR